MEIDMTSTDPMREWLACNVGEVDGNVLTVADHYHVFAVQDWGGSQQWMRGTDDRLTRVGAEQLAAEMAQADTAAVSGDPDRFEAARLKFGDERFSELVSGNVCPGWNAIWLIDCGDLCRFEETFHKKQPHEWGEPHWTPQSLTPEDEAAAHQEGIAFEHVRKGTYDENDLQLLGITREEAQKAHRDRAVQQLASRYCNDPGVLREALALIASSPF
jgi:hypothetical protein